MNTPTPCDKCQYLYYNVIYKEDPSHLAEGKLALIIGNINCESFKHWKETK